MHFLFIYDFYCKSIFIYLNIKVYILFNVYMKIYMMKTIILLINSLLYIFKKINDYNLNIVGFI